jgi:cullin 3
MKYTQGLTGKDENVDFETTWQILSSALLEIHTKNASKLSFEELYRNAYKLVLKKKGEELYNRVKGLEEDWLSHQIRTRIHSFVTPSLLMVGAGPQSGASANERLEAGERFLRNLRLAWKDHELTMSMITDVMMYMVKPVRLENSCTSYSYPLIPGANLGLPS